MPNPRRTDAARTLALLAGAVLAAAPLSASTPALAQSRPQQQGQNASDTTPEQLLADFIHYVKIDQRELAEAYGAALLELNLAPEQFLALVEDTPQAQVRFDEAVRDALRDSRLEPIAGELSRLLEQGRLAQARDPNAISRNIELLSGTLRARTLARQRLLEAKQYAVPQLLTAMTGSSDPVVALEARRLLIDLEADAVAPLAAALPKLGPAAQEQIAIVLGEIGYAEAAPYLAELARAPQVDGGVRAAATQALSRTAGEQMSRSAAELYRNLAERYYTEPRELTRFPDEEHQLVWVYEPALGLYPTPVRTEVFNEARAMMLTERALELDPATEGAVPLWLASNFRRQIETPENYDNPMYGADRREAMYYAVAAGADATQQVLARALADQNTALALRAIDALARTAGGASLWSGDVADKPLLQALSYPDRRVQFAAALVLGRARPSESFEGAERIVPVLAGAVRDTGERFAIVLGRSIEAEQRLAEMLQDRGYTVAGRGGSLNDVRSAVAETPGIDLLVMDLPRGATEDAVK
ncbi:MAG: HEAT repeat domain-containing protein, partial [Phycisphaerales bacterium]